MLVCVCFSLEVLQGLQRSRVSTAHLWPNLADLQSRVHCANCQAPVGTQLIGLWTTKSYPLCKQQPTACVCCYSGGTSTTLAHRPWTASRLLRLCKTARPLVWALSAPSLYLGGAPAVAGRSIAGECFFLCHHTLRLLTRHYH